MTKLKQEASLPAAQQFAEGRLPNTV